MGKGFAFRLLLPRFVTSEEIANAALFFATHDASYINGIALEVHGRINQI